MRISDLQSKDIVALEDGKKIGRITDVEMDNTGNMKALIIQKRRFFSFFFNQNEVEIAWKQVKKVGEDVILVELVIES